jgi:hypothetical protein
MSSREYFGDRKALIDEAWWVQKVIAVQRWRDPASLRKKVFLEREFPGA